MHPPRSTLHLVIEHNLDVIKVADYLIDLGPEGGDAGGQLVAQGTPEEVAKVKASYTGRYLTPLLEEAGKTASKQEKNAKKFENTFDFF